jgi:hypothetical protein
MGSNKTRIPLWFSVAFIGNSWRQCPVSTSPVEVRYAIEVFVESGLGLLPYDSEDLVDCSIP